MPSLLAQPALWIALTMAAVAAVTDLKTGLIPNRVVAIGAIAGGMVRLFTVALGEAPLFETLASIGLGLLLCGLLPFVLFMLGALGGGDLKLFAALGLCLGPTVGLNVQLWSHLLAGAFLPLYFLCKGGLRVTLQNLAQIVRNLVVTRDRRRPLDARELTTFRFAPAIFAATVWVCLLGSGQP